MVLAAVVALPATPLVGQWVESPLLRRGQISAFVTPFLSTYDERYGLAADGREGVEALGSELTVPRLGSTELPGLIDAERRFADLLADSAWVLNLGETNARVFSSVVRLPVGASVGVFDWLTVGGVAPFVKRRVELDFFLDPQAANTGLSPGSSDQDVQTFLAQANAALAAVMAKIDQTCMDLGEADPSCVSGRASLASANTFVAELEAAYGGALFLFGQGSAAEALVSRVDALRSELHSLADSAGIDTTFTAPLPFASAPLSIEQLQTFITDGSYGIGGDPLGGFASVWELGDVEFFAALRLLGTDRDPASEAVVADSVDFAQDSTHLDAPRPSKLGYLLGVQTTYRFGTGVAARPSNRLDIGTGDGLNDVEVKVFGRLDYGHRFRARVEGIYGIQLAGQVTSRVYERDLPFALFATQLPRDIDPGDYRVWMIAPEVRLTPELSVGARYRSMHRAADTYDENSVSAADALLLSAESEMNATHWGFGVNYWPSARSAAEGAWPVAVTAEYLAPVSGSGGQVPRGGQMRVQLRLFFNAW